jgi:serine protease AprX
VCVATAVLFAVLALPAAAEAARAYIPQTLHDAAAARPDATFSVIVEGRDWATTSLIAASVRTGESNDPGQEQGIHRRFRAISGVAAQLTGRQVLALERFDAVAAITPDVPLRPNLALPPANTGLPAVTGAAEPGATLTAAAGTWTAIEPPAYAYQWLRCDAAGQLCADVAGESTPTYAVRAADAGSTIAVRVTATDTGGSTSAVSAPSGVVASPLPLPPLAPPTNLALPVVSGDPSESATLTATDGAWAGGTPLVFARQWQRCSAAGDACIDIAGAVAVTYAVAHDHVGVTIRVVVTAIGDKGAASAASAMSGVIAPVPLPPVPLPPAPVGPASAGVPVVTGTPQVGLQLTATPGSWTGDAPIAYAYRWQRCSTGCTDVPGATGASYVPGAGDIGATMHVVVTATNVAASAESASAATAVVLPAPPVAVAAPTVAGAAVAGTTLAATAGTWTSATPVTTAYRWQRCDRSACADIAGEATASYLTLPADVGARIRVVVTAANDGGSTSATSASTDRVAPQSASGLWSWQIGPYAVHADSIWDTLATAQPPPAIAVVDSGVDSSLPGLQGAVTKQVTLTSLPQAARPDGYGHGSFVAAVAAGDGPGEASPAPTASIVSLDVMDDSGMAMTSDVIAAADWIYAHKDAEGIRVANFSLLGSSPSSFQYDPLDKALERLWLSGVVVVTAAGNYGSGGAVSDVAFAPANDPFVITVGAADVMGSVSTADDVAAPWSVYGHTADGFAKPELGAPGRYVVAPVPLDSTLYTTRPDRIVSEGRLQLSGTSFAAPVVAGLAADLLALHPTWTPDQVKGALMLTAAPTAASGYALGVGEVDAATALAVDNPPNPNAALAAFLVPDPAGGPTPVFDGPSWVAAAKADPAWSAASWGTASWGTASWGTASWGTASWGTAYWASASWGTASWGTSAVAVDNAHDDLLGGGGYWRWGP